MKVLNFGSLMYDYVYLVDHICKAGEEVECREMETYCGGKGLSQSVAMSRAGLSVFHAGFVGPDGARLLESCRESQIDPRYILNVFERTGNRVVQLTHSGENNTVSFAGANRQNQKIYIDAVLEDFGAGDVLVLQNEINFVDYIICKAADKGMIIILNPSPVDTVIHRCDLGKVAYLMINLEEGRQITGQNEPEAILQYLLDRYPETKVVLTLGKDGALYRDKCQTYRQGAYRVTLVDDTSAGDAFAGFFLGGILRGESMQDSLRMASIAAAIAVSRQGAVESIPTRQEVEEAKLTLA